jgi:Zn-dependent protease
MSLSTLSTQDVRWILTYVFVLLISVALHEFGHAIMADKLGDDTPRRQGRVTLNPLAHADPIGTLLLPLIGGIYGAASGYRGGFGWGKPVQWQPHRIARKWSMATAKILVAVAGPAMNLLLGTVIIVVHCALVGQHAIDPVGKLSPVLAFAARTNYVLLFFNLLPVPPLDGGHVLQSFIPYRHRAQFEAFARYSPFLVLAFMLIPKMQIVFTWPADRLAQFIYQGFASLFGV